MKTLILASALFAALCGSADASQIWTTLADTAPRSVFDDLNSSAPRTVFDALGESAPRGAEPRDLVGELQPAFDSLADSAP